MSSRTTLIRVGVILAGIVVPTAAGLHGARPAQAATQAGGSASASGHANNPFCARVGHTVDVSSGARMYCFGARANAAPGNGVPSGPSSGAASGKGEHVAANVDAAFPTEDQTPSGAQVYGQSEPSIAVNHGNVVVAWNDATGFFSPCGAPMYKEEMTGYGYSSDSGATFTDLGGLPNSNCGAALYSGDPSVETWTSGGRDYFYISSLYIGGTGSFIAMTACAVSGSGGAAPLCSQPVIMARQICTSFACSFLDKDFLTLDPQRGRLYVSYTDFGPGTGNGQIEVAACDIGTPGGQPGPIGGTASAPVCPQGAGPGSAPYLVVAPSTTSCENTGAYPAVRTSTGDLYVGWESNWASNLLDPSCSATPTDEMLAEVPLACLTLTVASPCTGPARVVSERTVSMDAAFIPGYQTRALLNDFPRVAVSEASKTVSMVWNNAVLHPTGDIDMQSWRLSTLQAIQRAPVVLNTVSGAWMFFPAVRQATPTGQLDVSWFDRRRAQCTACTDVYASVGVDPRATVTPKSNVRITNVASDWNAAVADNVPNFGDYIDEFVSSTGTLGVAWTDARIGEPQPFVAIP